MSEQLELVVIRRCSSNGFPGVRRRHAAAVCQSAVVTGAAVTRHPNLAVVLAVAAPAARRRYSSCVFATP